MHQHPLEGANTQTAGRHPEFLIQWVMDGPDKCISNRTPGDAYAASLGYHILRTTGLVAKDEASGWAHGVQG